MFSDNNNNKSTNGPAVSCFLLQCMNNSWFSSCVPCEPGWNPSEGSAVRTVIQPGVFVFIVRYILYKAPAGLKYRYIDSKGMHSSSDQNINHPNGVLANTLRPLFTPIRSMVSIMAVIHLFIRTELLRTSTGLGHIHLETFSPHLPLTLYCFFFYFFLSDWLINWYIDSLDKSPAHRRASLMSNGGFSILLKDTSTCSSALPRAGIWTSDLLITSRPALPAELQAPPNLYVKAELRWKRHF